MKEMQVAIVNLELNTDYMLRVLAENAKGRSLPSNTMKRLVDGEYSLRLYPSCLGRISYCFMFLLLFLDDFANGGSIPIMTGGDKPKHLSNSSNSDINYIDSSVSKSELSDNTLYLVLGAVLGSVVLILIVLVAVCGVKQRQQRRAMLGKYR